MIGQCCNLSQAGDGIREEEDRVNAWRGVDKPLFHILDREGPLVCRGVVRDAKWGVTGG